MKILFIVLLMAGRCYGINEYSEDYSFQVEPKYEFITKGDTVTIYKVPYKSMQMWVNTDKTVTIKVVTNENEVSSE